jgi:hypothetical protein
MSVATISYGSLKDSVSEAKNVAKKLESYANAINNTVYKKLNSYSGPWSSNLTNARNKANTKINALNSLAGKFETYATNITGLKSECETVDVSVKTKVSSLTATFKSNHGIKNSAVENAINNFFTGLKNKTVVGRWLGDGADKMKSGTDYFKDSIKHWYDYQGGKQLIKGVVEAALAVAIAALSVVILVLTGGALIAIIAAMALLFLAAFNAGVNIAAEMHAYKETKDNWDPATGRRISDINSIQDHLRVNTDSQFWHNVATGIDVGAVVCNVVLIASSVTKIFKGGIKWATGNPGATWGEMGLKNGLSSILSKTWGGIKELGSAIKLGNWSHLKFMLKGFSTDFMANLKNGFFKFDSLTDGLKSTKAWLDLSKGLLTDGLTIGVISTEIILPNITAFEYHDMGIDSGGQLHFDFDKSIDLGDLHGVFDKINSKIINSDAFSNDSFISGDVLKKLSTISSITIAVPPIQIPKIVFGVPAAAAA